MSSHFPLSNASPKLSAITQPRSFLLVARTVDQRPKLALLIVQVRERIDDSRHTRANSNRGHSFDLNKITPEPSGFAAPQTHQDARSKADIERMRSLELTLADEL